MLDGEVKIIESAVKGEASAFGLLYDHYQPKIYRFVLIKVSHREEAEDLTHQVFLHAWQSIGKYAHRGFPFSSWLYQIARNQVIDFYRSRKNESRLEDLDPESLLGHNTLEISAEHRLEFGRVYRAIQELKPEYQDVLIMRFIEELSSREVAGAIGKSEGAVKLMQYRAVRQLKKLLDA